MAVSRPMQPRPHRGHRHGPIMGALITLCLTLIPIAVLADSTAPSAVTDLATDTTTDDAVTLTWTAPGDDGDTGTASSYDVRYSTSSIDDDTDFSNASQASGEPTPQAAGNTEVFTVTGLNASTTYYFAIKTADEVPNWSGLSNSPSTSTDASSPNTVTFHPSGSASGDGASYTSSAADDMDSDDGDSSYGYSSDASNDFYVNLDNPSLDGTIDSVTIKGVAAAGGDWDDPTFKLGVKTHSTTYVGSEHGPISNTYNTYSGDTYTTNPDTGADWTWSEITDLVAVVDLTVSDEDLRVTELYAEVDYDDADTTAPDAVSDLAVSSTTQTNADLTWTAPGDDGASGTASVYDIRYSTSAITNSTEWDNATEASGEPTPSSAGSSESFTVTGLEPNTTYYFAIKTRDEVPNISGLSNNPSASTDPPPYGGYSSENTIPATQISQATDGSGVITINWKGKDAQSDNVTLNTFEYSVDGGSTWAAPGNDDDSDALATDWDDNGGSGWSTATSFGDATAHSFTFDTQHGTVSGLDGVDQSDVKIRFKLNDGTVDSPFVTSESFQVDNEAPTPTISSANYTPSTDTLALKGSNFTTIASSSSDITSDVDWSKLVWDINADDGTTTDITISESEVGQLTVTDDSTLTLVFTSAKATEIEDTTDYGCTGGHDTIDVTEGFSIDAFGNVATTDASADTSLTIGSPSLTVVTSVSVVSDPVNGSTDPLNIPGAVTEHSITVTNTSERNPDADSVIITDNIEAKLAFDVDNGVTFTDGSTSSNLAKDTVSYSDDSGPYTYDYTPSPDADGYDDNITSVKITTTGTFACAGSPDPSFILKFRTKVN